MPETPAGPEGDAPATNPEQEPPAKPEPEGDKPLTEYLILVKTGSETWTVGPKIKARGSNAAIRKHVENAGEGTYVAVPTRSWDPVTVATQTQTKLVFS